MRKLFGKFITTLLMLTVVLSASATFANEIVVGQINAQSGSGASLGKPLSIGAQIYIDRVNANGGIKNRKIKLITLDDQFKEQKTAEHAEQMLVSNNVIALINTLGAPNIDNLISSGYLDKHRLPVVGPRSGSTNLNSWDK